MFSRSFFSPPPSSLFTKNPENPIKSTKPIIPPKNPQISSRNFFNPISKNPQKRFSIPVSTVSEKVQRLDFEFKSLPEPIDRVKKLLYYANILPPFDESLKNQENRVLGCTAQVWLEVKMDENGVMRFSVDSDSEITKGFCSCLIWVLDGAKAEEVLSVKSDDLLEMNVGLPSRGNSRVNTWHNVLISMQKRTQDLVGKEKDDQCFEAVVSCLVAVNGSCKETQAPYEVGSAR